MRRVGRAAALAVAIAMALAAVGMAAAPKGGSRAGATASAAAATFSLTGKLTAVNSDAITAQVEKSSSNVKAFVHDGQVNVKLTKSTVIRQGGKKVSASALAAGESVQVSGAITKGAASQLVARVVTILQSK